MVLNLMLMILLIAFQQVFNISLFVTIVRTFGHLTRVIYNFETIRVNNYQGL
jgi:hypothetical protein